MRQAGGQGVAGSNPVSPTVVWPCERHIGHEEMNRASLRDAFLGYFTTGGANNGGMEAVNGLIELARRVARGFRDPDNYRLRMLLIGGGLRL